MVFRTVGLILFFSFHASFAFAEDPKLALSWKGPQDPKCASLLETFLEELRGLETERLVSLSNEQEASKSGTEPIALRCKRFGGEEALEASRGGEAVDLRFRGPLRSFEAEDWLTFQRKFLRPSLEPSPGMTIGRLPAGTPNPLLGSTETPRAVETLESDEAAPLYRKWWFWSIVAGAGASAYLLTRSSSGAQAVSVEIR